MLLSVMYLFYAYHEWMIQETCVVPVIIYENMTPFDSIYSLVCLDYFKNINKWCLGFIMTNDLINVIVLMFSNYYDQSSGLF